jgi:hypothetical protein
MSATLLGHWYCSFCNDVVNLPKPVGRYDLRAGVFCPVCRHNSGTWVPDALATDAAPAKHAPLLKPVEDGLAAAAFAKLREAAK